MARAQPNRFTVGLLFGILAVLTQFAHGAETITVVKTVFVTPSNVWPTRTVTEWVTPEGCPTPATYPCYVVETTTLRASVPQATIHLVLPQERTRPSDENGPNKESFKSDEVLKDMNEKVLDRPDLPEKSPSPSTKNEDWDNSLPQCVHYVTELALGPCPSIVPLPINKDGCAVIMSTYIDTVEPTATPTPSREEPFLSYSIDYDTFKKPERHKTSRTEHQARPHPTSLESEPSRQQFMTPPPALSLPGPPTVMPTRLVSPIPEQPVFSKGPETSSSQYDYTFSFDFTYSTPSLPSPTLLPPSSTEALPDKTQPLPPDHPPPLPVISITTTLDVDHTSLNPTVTRKDDTETKTTKEEKLPGAPMPRTTRAVTVTGTEIRRPEPTSSSSPSMGDTKTTAPQRNEDNNTSMEKTSSSFTQHEQITKESGNDISSSATAIIGEDQKQTSTDSIINQPTITADFTPVQNLETITQKATMITSSTTSTTITTTTTTTTPKPQEEKETIIRKPCDECPEPCLVNLDLAVKVEIPLLTSLFKTKIDHAFTSLQRAIEDEVLPGGSAGSSGVKGTHAMSKEALGLFAPINALLDDGDKNTNNNNNNNRQIVDLPALFRQTCTDKINQLRQRQVDQLESRCVQAIQSTQCASGACLQQELDKVIKLLDMTISAEIARECSSLRTEIVQEFRVRAEAQVNALPRQEGQRQRQPSVPPPEKRSLLGGLLDNVVGEVTQPIAGDSEDDDTSHSSRDKAGTSRVIAPVVGTVDKALDTVDSTLKGVLNTKSHDGSGGAGLLPILDGVDILQRVVHDLTGPVKVVVDSFVGNCNRKGLLDFDTEIGVGLVQATLDLSLRLFNILCVNVDADVTL